LFWVIAILLTFYLGRVSWSILNLGSSHMSGCLNSWWWTLICSLVVILLLTITSFSPWSLHYQVRSLVLVCISYNDTLTQSLIWIFLRSSCWILSVLSEVNRARRYSTICLNLVILLLRSQLTLGHSSFSIGSNIATYKIVGYVYGWWIDIVNVWWLNRISYSRVESTNLRRAASWSTSRPWVLGWIVCWIWATVMRHDSLGFLRDPFHHLITSLLLNSFISVIFWGLTWSARSRRNPSSQPLFGDVAAFSWLLIHCPDSWLFPHHCWRDYSLIWCACTFLNLSDWVCLISFIMIFFFNGLPISIQGWLVVVDVTILLTCQLWALIPLWNIPSSWSDFLLFLRFHLELL